MKKDRINEDSLITEINKYLIHQGFKINPHLRVEDNKKNTLKKIHQQKRKEKIRSHSKFLIKNLKKVQKYSISGEELEPEKIDLELIEIKSRSLYSNLFFWWNLMWWSLPYDQPVGRQMRFFLWDNYHDCPFGLFYLQSPPLRSAVRDNYLEINNQNVDYWINQSLYGQRIGAIPPFNELLGGKMVTLSLTSNEVRDSYEKKYQNKETLLEHRELPSKLLFVTTTSAYGKSSVYERISYNNEPVSYFLGFTSGAGTFHISEELYQKCLNYLEQKDINVKRGYGTGPSRKMKLISKAFAHLGIPQYTYHNIKRGYYLFSNVENLKDIIHNNSQPVWYDRPFPDLFDFWKERWCIPRSKRIDAWKNFDTDSFFYECRKRN